MFILADRALVRSILREPLFVALGVWGGYLLAVTFICGPPEIFRAFDMLRHFVLILCFVVIAAYLTASREDFPTDFSKVALSAAGLGAAASVAMFVGGDDARLFPVAMGRELLDGTMMYGGAVALGMAFLYRSGRRNLWRIAAVIACLALVLVLLALAQARGAVAALVVAAIVLALLGRGRVGAAIALAVTLTAIVISFTDLADFYGRLDSYRLMIWSEAMRIIGERPVFGYGITARLEFGTLPQGQRIYDPHSIFVANQIYGGLVGSLLLAALLAVFAWRALSSFRASGDPTAVALMVFGLVNGMTHGYTLISGANQFWLVYFLPIGLVIGMQVRSGR
ncbi:MAG: O-antigen ligase family protein [Rhodospirillales bacterium]